MPKYIISVYELHCQDFSVTACDPVQALERYFQGDHELLESEDSTSYIEVADKYSAKLNENSGLALTADEVKRLLASHIVVANAAGDSVEIDGIRGIALAEENDPSL